MNFTLLITVLLTAITLVVAAYVVAKLIGPRSYAKVKGEPYESFPFVPAAVLFDT